MGSGGSKTPRTARGEKPNRDQKILYVILPISNPLKIRRREALYRDTVQRLTQAKQQANDSPFTIRIITSQILYGDEPDNHESPTTLSFRVAPEHVLWSKENLINLAISRTMAEDPSAKYFSWVDADIEFMSPTWIQDTINAIDNLEARGGGFVQMFSTATHLGPHLEIECQTKSFGAQFVSGTPYTSQRHTSADYWHPGFAWAAGKATLKRLERSPGVYLIDRTLGGADRHMAMSFLRLEAETVPPQISEAYRQMILEWARPTVDLGLGCVPGEVRHYWHGSLANRKYVERWDILIKHEYDPELHVTTDKHGALIWSPNAPPGLVSDVLQYFKDRNEDEFVPNPSKQEKKGGNAGNHGKAQQQQQQQEDSQGLSSGGDVVEADRGDTSVPAGVDDDSNNNNSSNDNDTDHHHHGHSHSHHHHHGHHHEETSGHHHHDDHDQQQNNNDAGDDTTGPADSFTALQGYA
eukprot:c26796_g1_i1.p1 GENE.c26796_g1_i1~~c26796_g1_i1.p1  ORF type:complete len:479 (+),score=97.52 c26796_g1_i1:39-1439(+)